MLRDVLKNQYLLNGSFRLKSGISRSFSEKWGLWRQIDTNWWLISRSINHENQYTIVYVIHFPFLQPHKLTEAERFNIMYPSPDMITNVSDKLRYYRYKKALRQRDVAEFIGIDRGTYARYEENPEYIPVDSLVKIAKLFEIQPEELLLDDYNKFLFNNQGKQIKDIRKRLGMTQNEFGKRVGVHGGTVKRWESNKIHIQRSTYEKIMSIS